MIRNTFVVWLFTGLWHGASWNFVLWGLVLFGILMIEKNYIGNFMNRHRIIGHAYMILIIPLTWLLFAVTDFSQLGTYFSRLVDFSGKKRYLRSQRRLFKILGYIQKVFYFRNNFLNKTPRNNL